MNQTITPNRPILHLKSNQNLSIEANSGFEVYGFKVKIARDGRRIRPDEFKRFVVEKLITGELITKNVAKTCDIERTMVHQWKREIRNKDRIASTSEDDNEASFVELVSQNSEKTENEKNSISSIRVKVGNVNLAFSSDFPPDNLMYILRGLLG